MNKPDNIRDRGGNKHRPSRKALKETHDKSTSQLVAESGKYYECFHVEEDRSITKSSMMRLWDPGRTLLRKGKPLSKQVRLRRDSSRTHKRDWNWQGDE